MSERILEHPEFKAGVANLKAGLTRTILAKSTDEGQRNEALLKYHLIDDLVATLASAAKA